MPPPSLSASAASTRRHGTILPARVNDLTARMLEKEERNGLGKTPGPKTSAAACQMALLGYPLHTRLLETSFVHEILHLGHQ